MIRVSLVVVLVFHVVVGEIKGEPSTLQAALNDGYYLGSGDSQSKNSRYSQNKEPALSEEEIKIVQDVFSPDYYEPNIILDYRYLKSGGRGYARSDGGQILILPRRNQILGTYNNYDTLIEYLRLKHLKEIDKHWIVSPQKTSNGQQFSNLYDGALRDEDYPYTSDAEKGWSAYVH